MKKIIFYLLVSGSFYLWLLILALTSENELIVQYQVPFKCGIIGGLGGIIYCLRSVYVNVAVYKNWGSEWHVWYVLRPITSFACGAVSYVFLRAGLLFLESGVDENASEFGFYALAFIAGLNVDKFIQKLEGVGEAVWGIDKSRSRKRAERSDEK